MLVSRARANSYNLAQRIYALEEYYAFYNIGPLDTILSAAGIVILGSGIYLWWSLRSADPDVAPEVAASPEPIALEQR